MSKRQVLHFDFGVATSWQADVHQAVDGLWSWVHDVDKSFMYAHFKLFAGFFVNVR